MAKQIYNPLLEDNFQEIGTGGGNVEDPNIVHVFQASDLPAALVTNTTYVIHGTVTTANTILVANQNTAIIGLNRDNNVQEHLLMFLTLIFS
jgi:hypothetical protein